MNVFVLSQNLVLDSILQQKYSMAKKRLHKKIQLATDILLAILTVCILVNIVR